MTVGKTKNKKNNKQTKKLNALANSRKTGRSLENFFSLSHISVWELNHSSTKEPQLAAVLGFALRPHTPGKALLCSIQQMNVCCMYRALFFFIVTDRNDQLKSSSLVDKTQRKMVAVLEKDVEVILAVALICP